MEAHRGVKRQMMAAPEYQASAAKRQRYGDRSVDGQAFQSDELDVAANLMKLSSTGPTPTSMAPVSHGMPASAYGLPQYRPPTAAGSQGQQYGMVSGYGMAPSAPVSFMPQMGSQWGHTNPNPRAAWFYPQQQQQMQQRMQQQMQMPMHAQMNPMWAMQQQQHLQKQIQQQQQLQQQQQRYQRANYFAQMGPSPVRPAMAANPTAMGMAGPATAPRPSLVIPAAPAAQPVKAKVEPAQPKKARRKGDLPLPEELLAQVSRATAKDGKSRSRRQSSNFGFKGITQTRHGRWQAQIHVNGPALYLGTFPTPLEAALVYDVNVLKHKGPHAQRNFQDQNPQELIQKYFGDTHRSQNYKGVSSCGTRWRAKIYHCGKSIHLGHFDTSVAAAQAYDEAATRLRGPKAKVNFPAKSNKANKPGKTPATVIAAVDAALQGVTPTPRKLVTRRTAVAAVGRGDASPAGGSSSPEIAKERMYTFPTEPRPTVPRPAVEMPAPAPVATSEATPSAPVVKAEPSPAKTSAPVATNKSPSPTPGAAPLSTSADTKPTPTSMPTASAIEMSS